MRRKRIKGCGKHKIATRRCKDCIVRVNLYRGRLEIIEDLKEMRKEMGEGFLSDAIETLESCEDLETT